MIRPLPPGWTRPVEAAEGTDELREALMEHFASTLSLYVGDQLPDAVADLLATPPVVSLLAKVRAVEDILSWLDSAPPHAVGRRETTERLRRALDGTR